eukprot:CAMPEP_0185836892 /NCGR_PEP_ID=MMETSP1353-20130828/10463_1 /TAXON_ID=1077150 /ORGANISM="Erythrolobus australicus, Strain CCMP3124" /LENGTH=66 /DNA_ID=CAMNT_0028535737 /DNA_START=1 /DNA_END=198 /DNA_ORIENTATION=+
MQGSSGRFKVHELAEQLGYLAPAAEEVVDSTTGARPAWAEFHRKLKDAVSELQRAGSDECTRRALL